MRIQKIFLLIGCILVLASCHGDHAKKAEKKEKIVVAQLQTPIQRLYFTGSLSPLETIPVISPVEGNIISRHFEYGERVEKEWLLFVIDSKTLAQEYRKDIKTYIQAKQSFDTKKVSFEGTKALYKAGVIAKNEYDDEKTAYENAQLDFLQAKFSLEKILKTANVDVSKVSSKQIESLTLADTEKVNQLLERHFKHIEITAPGSGVALFPKKRESGDGGVSGKVETGTAVKEGQLLLSIGDLSGLSATFNVSEIDIDKIQDGMPVRVTGSAFPHATLKGYICAVSIQAVQNGDSSGLSMYSVSTKIPQVDPEVMKKIRVGMTAKFEVDIKGTPRIMLPVNAIFQQNGKSFVKIVDPKGKLQIAPVETGITTPTDVVIISGVKVGDKVVINNPLAPVVTK